MNRERVRVSPTFDLEECAICGRRFMLERIKAHEIICQRSYAVSRKSFDVAQQRIKGTQAEKYVLSQSQCNTDSHKNRPCSLITNWRNKREDCLRKISEAKILALDRKPINDLPFPPKELDTDYVQCPHCFRHISQKSASRHIQACSTRMCNKNSKTTMTAETSKTTLIHE